MKRLAIIAALIGLASGVHAQRQTFLLPSYFTTNVFLHDNTNTPLHTRIQNAEATNASGWSGYVATTNANFAGLSITNLGSVQMKTNPVTTTWTNEGNVYWENTWDTLAIVTGEKNTDGTPVIDEVDFNSYVWVKNVSGEVISNGVAVAIIPDSGGVLTVSPATYPTNANVIGITTHDIASGAEARVNYFGSVGQAKTYGLNENAAIYLATNYANGINWTTNKTGGPRLGYITRAATSPTAGNGSILVEIANANGSSSTGANFNVIYGTNINLGGFNSSSFTGISSATKGSIRAGLFEGLSQIRGDGFGNVQLGFHQDGGSDSYLIIEDDTRGAIQRGSFEGVWTTNRIGRGAHGAEQAGHFIQDFAEVAVINDDAYGAGQRGYFEGSLTIGSSGYGSHQFGYVQSGGVATNLARGAIQLLNLSSGDIALTDSSAHGSLLLGPGTNSVAYSVRAAGGFYGDGANVTNVNARQLNGLNASAYVTVSSFQSSITNFARFLSTTQPPTSNTASGSHGELRVDATNLYIYIGAGGTNKWLRIPGSFTW
jgi:hypothetical protein